MDELLREYAEQFDEAFPVFGFAGNDEELEKTIKDCLKTNKAYVAKYDDEVDY